ncbi:MAG: dependent ligase [Streptosporangiaceae bacterium]|nr:dependent ligase [Streptosporangiaceae bacterium]
MITATSRTGICWTKVRAKNSAEAILGAPHAPTALILGRYDHRGRLRVIGRTFPLPHDAQADIAAVLAEPTAPHPWPTVLPGSRFGLPGAEPVTHTPVAPTVVVEIEVDHAYEAGRYRHGVKYLRIRAELHPMDRIIMVE